MDVYSKKLQKYEKKEFLGYMFMIAAKDLRLTVAGVIVALARSVNSMTKTTSLQ